jgi:hypothetical protein
MLFWRVLSDRTKSEPLKGKFEIVGIEDISIGGIRRSTRRTAAGQPLANRLEILSTVLDG